MEPFWRWLRREEPAAWAPGDGPPVLEWVRRANAAQGAWLVGSGTRETSAPAGGIPAETDRLVRVRLEQHRLGDAQGVERLDRGLLVYASLDGRAAALLLPDGASASRRELARHDLARLVDYDRWRPILAEVTRQQGTPGESVESIALRLAHQLERQLGVEAAVALPRGSVVEIAGVSLRSDRRLMGTVLDDSSPLARVARGQSGDLAGVDDPLGGAIGDRRNRWGLAYVAPIPWSGSPVGAVAVWSPSGTEPRGGALAAFRATLDAAGPRLQAATDRRTLAEMAIRDPLTGALNRRGLDERLRSVASGVGALVYADLDHFKKLNDTLGHPAGDQALIHFARLLEQAVRDGDVVARIGGEEFAVWLPGASLERGRQVAERVRQAFSWSDWRWQGERWPLTASFGVAACPETAPRVELLPAQADRALYTAKREGRDRVAVEQGVRD
ncbi:MAG: diguanylate cyclase [Gemmatimonadales bacterium]